MIFMLREIDRNRFGKKHSVLIAAFVFFVGLCIMLYPFVANWTYQRSASKMKIEYQEAVVEYLDEELQNLMNKMYEYNKLLAMSNVQLTAEFAPDKYEFDALYMSLPMKSKEMGYIDIPAINVTLPIYHTTESDILEKGAGHLIHTSLPIGGESTHAVISTHSGLPNAEMFTNLNKLCIDNIFKIEIMGKTLIYKVYDKKVVLPNEVESLVIQQGRDLVTLVTCTPLYINSHRLLVYGQRVMEEDIKEAITLEPEPNHSLTFKDYVFIIGAVLTFVFLINLFVVLMVNKGEANHPN